MSEVKIRNHAAVRRVAEVLASAGLPDRVVVLPETARTADDAAAALGVETGAIVKSLIFLAADEPILVLASGGHRVDTGIVAAVIGTPLVRADADRVREVTGMSIGGVAPLGHLQPATVFIDEALGAFDVVWAAAGHPYAVWPTTLDELALLTGGRTLAVASEEPG